MTTRAGTLIIGASQAGLSAAAELRKRGYDAPIGLIGAEPVAPYQRPPLSKGYLTGETPLDRLWLKPEAFYAAQAIELHLGARAEAIDRAAGRLALEGGAELDFDHLILATGGRARIPPIPGAGRAGVYALRTLADADALSAALEDAERLVIIGAGYIGLEAAASAVKRGLSVTVIEAADRPLARTASPALSDWFAAAHRAQGVDLRLSTQAAAIEGAGETGRTAAVRLADGARLGADLVLIAAGLVPDTGLAEAAGLSCQDGVLVDAHACAADDRLYAIGDVARFESARYRASVRLESVQNAIDQAKAAAAAICGEAYPYDPVPWFWSDQYGYKLQIAGLAAGADQIITRGDPAEGRFALFHLKDGALIACEAVNAAPEYMAAQRLIALAAQPDPRRLGDLSVAMRDFLS